MKYCPVNYQNRDGKLAYVQKLTLFDWVITENRNVDLGDSYTKVYLSHLSVYNK